MSARVYGTITISVVGKRSQIVRLDVSWTSNADKRKQVSRIVDAWARNARKWWGVYVDATTLETGAGGRVFINDDQSAFVAQFSVQEKGATTPPPVPAFSIAGGRR